MKTKLKNLLKRATYIFFPKRCGVCDKVIDIDTTFCPICETKLKRIPHYVALLWSHGNTNFRPDYVKPKFSGCLAPFMHESGSRKLIYCFKFKNRMELADLIADEMSDVYFKYYEKFNIDIMTAVPMRLSAKMSRGYDQVDELCKRLTKRINLPYKKLLKQTGKKKPQHMLRSARLRPDNVRGIYSYVSKEDIKGKTVLLVDDIITTGATVNECAKMLRRAGAKEVFCLSATIHG